MHDLNELRVNIDRINNSILELLKERFEYVKKVGEYKKANNQEIYVKSREDAIIAELTSKKENIPAESVKRIFLTIMEESRNYEK